MVRYSIRRRMRPNIVVKRDWLAAGFSHFQPAHHLHVNAIGLRRPLHGGAISAPNVHSWPGATFRDPSSSDVVCPIKYRLIQINSAPSPERPSPFQTPPL